VYSYLINNMRILSPFTWSTYVWHTTVCGKWQSSDSCWLYLDLSNSGQRMNFNPSITWRPGKLFNVVVKWLQHWPTFLSYNQINITHLHKTKWITKQRQYQISNSTKVSLKLRQHWTPCAEGLSMRGSDYVTSAMLINCARQCQSHRMNGNN